MPTRLTSRWRNFSLRTLFLLMTASCVLLGLWVLYVSPYRDQAKSIAVVARLGGQMRKVPAKGPAWQRWLVTTMLGPDTFVDVIQINLNNRNLDASDLRALRGLRNLEDLALNNTPIDDAALAELSNFPGLTGLYLRYTATSDAGTAHLAEVKSLETLNLTGTKVTDASIDVLARILSLRELYIRWTKITDEGASQLRAALPTCEINHHALATTAN